MCGSVDGLSMASVHGYTVVMKLIKCPKHYGFKTSFRSTQHNSKLANLTKTLPTNCDCNGCQLTIDENA
ncbi:hypothetical protein JTE90_028697 [Oedothorax gibbosus]|uniref:Uncharacterized protein n=1 Tax=Oedothorax gibbosus TaxID=931172 RepID=A0AAV6U0C4_9ARAC|nr:hypothetical protein JTE90_028697 [Oedothorax gibbosus]